MRNIINKIFGFPANDAESLFSQEGGNIMYLKFYIPQLSLGLCEGVRRSRQHVRGDRHLLRSATKFSLVFVREQFVRVVRHA